MLKIRKKNSSKNLKINFNEIMKILKTSKITNKSIGGYYPYNYEVDAIDILKKFEKKNIKFHSQKLKKISR